MKKIAVCLLGISALAHNAIAQTAKTSNTGFKTTKDGIEYKFIKDAPGTQTPKIGDMIQCNYTVKIGDSIMFDSYKANAGKPMEIPMQQNPNPNKKMDPTEVLMMLTVGDSVVIRTELDSNALKQLTFAKATDKIQYQFALKSIKTKEQFEAEVKNAAANQAQTDDKILTEYFAKNNIKAQKTASGLYYVITKKGEGSNATTGQSVTVNYTGKNITDGSVFDSNVDPQFQHVEPFTFNLGQHQVIAGWDEGIALLNKGAKATLYIPSTMAYGAQSPSPKIPANGILIFDVELVSFK
ncbi:MAG: FKBP-type peptidyl-prolyl cis-trans isomerase [Phycisphaerales bacterium]|nr:FKBP-type peptidyl-prolyl cis-trans isomerase [Phycisphaerales bacterium]